MQSLSGKRTWILAAMAAVLLTSIFVLSAPLRAYAASDLQAAGVDSAFTVQATKAGTVITLKAKSGEDITKKLKEALQVGKSGAGYEQTTVKVPAGKFKINSANGLMQIYSNTNLVLDKNTVITLTGAASTCKENFIMLQGAHYNLKTGQKCLHSEGNCQHKGYTQLSNISITGGTWDGNCKKHSDWNVGGILLRHGQNITLKNVNMRNFTNHAINISGTKNDVVTGCTFTNSVKYTGNSKRFWGDKVRTKQGKLDRIRSTEALHLDFCNLAGESTSYPLDGTPCRNIKISNCTFNKTYGGIGTHHDNTKKAGGISVSNCKFTLKDGTAVNFFTCKSATVTKCTVKGGDSILRANKANVKISNCKATKCDGSVIGAVNSSKLTATNNKIEAIGDAGIWIDTKARGVLKNNTISGTKKCLPIDIDAGYATVSGNKIKGGELSISVKGPSGACKITGNTITGSYDNAIYIMECTNGAITVSKNTVNGAETAAVRVNKSENVNVLNNTLSDAHYEISVDATKNMTISGNKAHGGKSVIRIDGQSTKVNVTKNVLKPEGKGKLCSGDAITFDGKSTGSVTKNTIVRAGDSAIDIDKSCKVKKKGNKVQK